MRIEKKHFDSIDSTNSYAKRAADTFNPKALTLITASEQTAGRGRFRREWISPKDMNLYASFIFFLKTLRDDLGNIPQVLALSAVETLKPYVDNIKIKWPNDLVVKEEKLGGILCELTQSQHGWAMIAGIGMNINMPDSLLKKIDRPATSLLKENRQEYSIDTLSKALAEKFLSDLTLFLLQGFEPFLESFTNALVHKKNGKLKFNNFKEQIEGKFEGINEDGSLSLLLEDGSVLRCTTGELV